jgi:hypothetical protein
MYWIWYWVGATSSDKTKHGDISVHRLLETRRFSIYIKTVKGKIERYGDKELASVALEGGNPYPRSGNRKGTITKTLSTATGEKLSRPDSRILIRSFKYRGAMPIKQRNTSDAILNTIRWITGGQWREHRTGVMDSQRQTLQISQTAEFCTRWSFAMLAAGRPTSKALP